MTRQVLPLVFWLSHPIAYRTSRVFRPGFHFVLQRASPQVSGFQWHHPTFLQESQQRRFLQCAWSRCALCRPARISHQVCSQISRLWWQVGGPAECHAPAHSCYLFFKRGVDKQAAKSGDMDSRRQPGKKGFKIQIGQGSKSKSIHLLTST